MSTDFDLLRYFETSLPQSLALLRQMVEIESHSLDKSGVDALAEFLAREFEARGAGIRILHEPVRGNLLECLWNAGSTEKHVLVLGHLDTVWPRGSVAARPFRLEQGRAYGPGVFDMKAGLLISLLACEAFQNGKASTGNNVVFLFTSDEELGTEAGLAHLREAARDCRAVLCLEPPLPGGKAKTFRKGVGSFHLTVRGVAAHAGVDYEKGANAILELCRLAIQLQELTDHRRSITVSVGTIKGGTASNVVPDHAEADVDFRVATVADGRRIEEQVQGLRPSDPRCTLEICGGLNRPPLERTDAVVRLYQKAQAAAAAAGMDLGEGSTGGGSDGSFTAAMGIPTLDGLGCAGDGAHASNEHIEVEDIPRRAAFLCRLLQALD